MPSSTVIVQHSDGKPAAGLRVVLGFGSGMTRAEFTDTFGQAIIAHSSGGDATVFVAGKESGKFHAPGRIVVTL